MENNLQFINDSWGYVSKSVNLNNFTFSCTLKGREVFHLKKKQKKKQMTKKHSPWKRGENGENHLCRREIEIV